MKKKLVVRSCLLFFSFFAITTAIIAEDYLWIYQNGKVECQVNADSIDSVAIQNKRLIRMFDKQGNVLYSSLFSKMDSISVQPYANDSLLSLISYTVNPFLTKELTSKQQGMDIYDSLIFTMIDGGQCAVYPFAKRTESTSPLALFDLGSKRSGNHTNTANFGIEIPEGSSFPLLYVSIGKPGDADEYALYVEKISRNANVFSSELVQTIRMDQSNYDQVGLQPIWGCPNWVIDKERGYLWAFSAIKRTLVETTGDMSTNKYVATQFRIPALSEGKEVILTEKDVLKQSIFPFDVYITQGGTMQDGKIYYAFGYGGTGNQPPAIIRIFDTDTEKIVGRMELLKYVTQEPEDLSLYKGKLYLNTNSSFIYELNSPFWDNK